MSTVLLLTSARESSADILPSLGLLPHSVRVAAAAAEHVAGCKPAPEVVLIDARRDLVQARRVLRALRAGGSQLPVLVIVTDGGWAASSADWGADDFILHTAGPGEVEARLRLAIGRSAQVAAQPQGEIRSGGLVINEATYSARINGRALDLTFKEFELLKFLAQYPGRVFTRAQLLQEVWGYDYFGGTRTVDVHVRRLRAKLGADNEELIGTVRNVGYRFVPAKARSGVIPDDRAGQPSPPARQDASGGGRAGSRSNGERGDGRPPGAQRDDGPYAPRPADTQQSAAYADS